MKRSKRIALILGAAVVCAAGLFLLLKSKPSRFPYRERKELRECVDFFIKERDTDKRIEFLQAYVKKYFRDVEVHRTYQDFMRRLRQGMKIRDEYRNYQKDHPDDPMFNYLHARLMNQPRAEEFYKKSIEKDKNFYWGYLGLGYFYARMANPPNNDLALEHLNKAVEIDNTLPYAYVSLFQVNSERHDMKGALDALSVLVKFFPTRDDYFLEYATKKYTDMDELRSVLEKKLRDIPDSALLKKAVGESYVLKGDLDKALFYLEEALQGEKDDRSLIRALNLEIADIYAVKKDAPRVIGHLRAAVDSGLIREDLIKENKNFDFLKENPEFLDLVKRVESTPEKRNMSLPSPPEDKEEVRQPS